MNQLRLFFSLLPFIFVFIFTEASGQFWPHEGARLNYRLVGFYESWAVNEHDCKVEVAKGIFDNEPAFKSSIVATGPCDSGKVILELPEFGADYTWRVVQPGRIGQGRADFHHFRTWKWKTTDTGHMRLRILNNEHKHASFYVFVDADQTMYDTDGAPVWFLPPSDTNGNGRSGIRDLKVTPFGTLTFISGELLCEADFQGRILWNNPGGEKSKERFHHEFTRLPDGNYMALGTEFADIYLPFYKADTLSKRHSAQLTRRNDSVFQRVPVGTVVAYGRDGKEVWRWSSESYFRQSDVFRAHTAEGLLPMNDVHENAFYFDGERHRLLIGFRDISRILEVSYPEGKVTHDWGKRSTGADSFASYCNSFFCGQHRIMVTRAGKLCVYNNNPGAIPSVVLLKENKKMALGLENEWEYDLNLEGLVADSQVRNGATQKEMVAIDLKGRKRITSGGTVEEMEDGSLFIVLSEIAKAIGGKFFIVNSNKEIEWSAVLEQYLPDRKAWQPFFPYRASHLMDGALLQKLVWNGFREAEERKNRSE